VSYEPVVAIAGVTGAKVVWNAQNIVGAHGRGGHKEAAGKLERFDFATGRTETLAEKIDDFAIAGDGISLVYRDGKALRVHLSVVRDLEELEELLAEPSFAGGVVHHERIPARAARYDT